jgi:hypothetical protein
MLTALSPFIGIRARLNQALAAAVTAPTRSPVTEAPVRISQTMKKIAERLSMPMLEIAGA